MPQLSIQGVACRGLVVKEWNLKVAGVVEVVLGLDPYFGWEFFQNCLANIVIV